MQELNFSFKLSFLIFHTASFMCTAVCNFVNTYEQRLPESVHYYFHFNNWSFMSVSGTDKTLWPSDMIGQYCRQTDLF